MASDETQSALLEFCAASQELSQIDETTCVARRAYSRTTSTLRELLREQMIASGVNCVPVSSGNASDGKPLYAVLQTTARSAPISAPLIMRTLRELAYDPQQQMPPTLEEWIVQVIQRALQAAAPEGPPRAPVVALSKKPLDAAVAKTRIEPADQARVQETVEALHNASRGAKELRARNSARLKALRATTKTHEARVAEHLLQHDPTHATRRVRLVQGDVEASYCLRRKKSVRESRPTARTVLPALRNMVRTMREGADVDASPTWAGYRWLTSHDTLARLEPHIVECIERIQSKKESSRVVLTRLD